MDSKIIVIGIGPGSPDYVPPVASRAIARAKVLLGSERALGTFAPPGCVCKAIDKDLAAAFEFIRDHLATGDVTVLVSGDPGFYSLLSALRKQYPAERLEVIPGISSVQLAFARLACPWQEAELVSLHGREIDNESMRYRTGKQLALLTDPLNTPDVIAKRLRSLDWPPDAQVWLCAELSYPSETVAAHRLAEIDGTIGGYPACVMVVKA